MKRINILVITFITVCLISCDKEYNTEERIEENSEIIVENKTDDVKSEELDIEITSNFSSGFYDDSFKLLLSTKDNAEIYYTLDGKEPTKESLKYENGIQISKKVEENKIANITNISSLTNVYFPNFKVDKCTTLKAKSFTKDGIESETKTYVFFVGLDDQYYSNLPIVCLNTDYDNLFDYEKGIYITGKTYDEGTKTGYPETYPANYNNTGKEWERISDISILNEEHNLVLNQSCGIRIHGGWTRAFNQKSFNIYARKEYDGNKKIKTDLFNGINPKTFMLRSGGYRDSLITKVRDSMIQTLCSNLGFETQMAYPCVTFLNDEYWGIYLIQERFSDTFIEEHYGIDKDNVVIFEKDSLDEGKAEDIELYSSMRDFFLNNDLSSEVNYNEASNIIDIDGFINYMCCELIVGNTDWPNNNFRMWRSRDKGTNCKEDCKWRFMMYDTDDSCSIISKCSADSNPYLNVTHWSCGPLDSNCTIGLIFTSLLKNEDFKNKFYNQMNNILNNVLTKENVEDYLNKQINLLSIPMEHHYERFVSDDRETYNREYYINEVNKITEFFKSRKAYIIEYTNDTLN